jgi:hypothetical protein
VHVLDWPDRTLSLPPLGAHVSAATTFPAGDRVEFTQTDTGITLTLPSAAAAGAPGRDPDHVIVLVAR